MTPRTVRVGDEQWAEAIEASDYFNENISEAFRQFLDEYIARYKRESAKAATAGKQKAVTRG